jgi:hypothetical protein
MNRSFHFAEGVLMSPFELRTLPLSELKPAPYHPRQALAPTSPAYRKLKAGIAAFGLVEPLVWNERTGHVIGGHLRLRILEELGYTEVPVSVVRLSRPREKALNVLLNNTKAQGRFAAAKLEPLFAGLGSLFDLTGFDRGVLTSLRLQPAAKQVRQEECDRVEVTLVTDAAKYAALTAALDKLVGDYGLTAHVRGA